MVKIKAFTISFKNRGRLYISADLAAGPEGGRIEWCYILPTYINGTAVNKVIYYNRRTNTVEKYFQGVLILASVLFVLYREALVVERLRRLPRMHEVVGLNPTEGKICFSQFTLFNRVECEKLFCKTNLKLKVVKLIKTKYSYYLLYVLWL